jgi:guanylate kinase
MAGEMNQKFGLIVVSAPSGAGKSSLCARLLQALSERLSLSISTTSRAPRGVEKNGVDYFFVTPDGFRDKVSQGEFAEWALVHDNYYGTSKQTLHDFWSRGKHVLLDIDVQGTHSLKQAFPEKTLTVFIAPPSLEVLEQRLRGRGTESEEAVQKRMKNSVQEMSRQSEFDLIILNDEFDRAYAKLEEAVISFMDQLERGSWQSPK